MFNRVNRALRHLRRRFNRSEWAVRLLGLSRSTTAPSSPGLLLIQIDGLGRHEFDAAIKAGRMPFMRRLLKRERYQLRDLYAGVPCTTPAVQAELFYGQKTSVPGFSFRHPESGEIIKMFEPGPAHQLEAELRNCHEPLLSGGAAYGNIFTGGADDAEAHFCVAALGWGPVLRAANPLSIGLLVVTNFGSVLRVGGLLALELLIAVVDFARGVGRRFQLLKELLFIPARVAICIGLRELIAIGATIDIARGLPIIHLNLAGYDEQAHRRGPQSAFAHWSLKGIDRTIARLWHAALRAEHRDYRVWIYSDHGQERVMPYPLHHGRTIQQAVEEIVADTSPGPVNRGIVSSTKSYRNRTLTGRQAPIELRESKPAAATRPVRSEVVAMGPVGFVYLPQQPDAETKRALAERLVTDANVPAVLAPMDSGQVHAWTCDGEWVLPRDGERLVGATHRFKHEVIDDILALVRHPAAGDLVLAGWCTGRAPVSFAPENGAHGGFAPCETNGIALVDAGTAVRSAASDYIRAGDLRCAALALMGREQAGPPAAPGSRREAAMALRVVTYNVHGCVGMDGRTLPHRVARVIADLTPDIVALQELDVGRARSGAIDQAHEIAAYLSMKHFFHASYSVREEHYGNAVLSTLPLRLIKAGRLPGFPQCEPRGAIWVAIDVEGVDVQVLNTHLGLRAEERRIQIECLMSGEWLGGAADRGPVVVCGDFNAGEHSLVWRQLRARYLDVQRERTDWVPRNTWFGRRPTRRLDHIFVSTGVDVRSLDVPQTRLSQIASDHLPLMAELSITAPEPTCAPAPKCRA